MDSADIKSPWYEPINPNGKVPAIVHVKEDGTSETVFEFGACLLYLAHEFDKEHRFHDPVGSSGYWKQLSWVSLVFSTMRNHGLTNHLPYLIAVVADLGLRTHDGPGRPLPPLHARAGPVRSLALWG